MAGYTLDNLNKHPWGPYNNHTKLAQDAKQLAGTLKKKPQTERITQLREALLRQEYQFLLDMINGFPEYFNQTSPLGGYGGPRFSKEKEASERAMQRLWSKRELTNEQRNRMLNLGAEATMIEPQSTHSQNGLTALYQHLFTVPGTVFANAAKPELEARLQNGRFWETLAYIGSGNGIERHAVDVLRNHSNKLAPWKASVDYERFARNLQLRGAGLSLERLSRTELGNYVTFVNEVAKMNELTTLQMLPLFAPLGAMAQISQQ